MAIKRNLVAFMLLFAVCGCASARRGIGDNVAVPKIINIVPGETSESEIRMIFGVPDIAKDLDEGEVEYTYIQGRNDSVSWLVLSGYLLYHPTEAFMGDRILIVNFKDGKVRRFLASDGKMAIKKGYESRKKGSNEKKPEGE